MLLHFSDLGSLAMQHFTGFYYTHASIGLDEDMNTFYSFVYKGFLIEKLTYYVKLEKEKPCMLYEIEVSSSIYKSIKDYLISFNEQKSNLEYTRLGLILALLHIPFKWTNHYFCSQFVAETLKQAQAVLLKKSCCLYLPYDFICLDEAVFCFEGSLNDLLHDYHISYK